jgi:hypothetical protein
MLAALSTDATMTMLLLRGCRGYPHLDCIRASKNRLRKFSQYADGVNAGRSTLMAVSCTRLVIPSFGKMR